MNNPLLPHDNTPATCNNSSSDFSSLEESFLHSKEFSQAFQIIMDFDSWRLGSVPLDKNAYGISRHWKIHKTNIEGGIPKKIELYAYFPREVLEDFLASVSKRFRFAEKTKAPHNIYYVALALDKNKVYTSDWKEYSGSRHGYKHELTQLVSHRRECYLLRIYRLVKPEENDYFKLEFSYMKQGEKKSIRSAYALNKFKSLTELARKIEQIHEPVHNPDDYSGGCTIEAFEEAVRTGLAEERPKQTVQNPDQLSLFDSDETESLLPDFPTEGYEDTETV